MTCQPTGIALRCLAVIMAILPAACATDKFYSPAFQQAPPQRWADPITVCPRGTGIVAGLGIAVSWAYIPPMQSRPCADPSGPDGFVDADDAYLGEALVDPSGRGFYAFAYYRVTIDNPYARRHGEGLVAEELQPTLKESFGPTVSGARREWRFHEQIYSRQETINGLIWQHYAFALYDSFSDDPSVPGQSQAIHSQAIAEPVNNAAAVGSITEVYVHPLDDDHAVIAMARFGRPVIEDMGWYASRSALLGRLLNELEIRPITSSAIETAREEFRRSEDARRAADRSSRKR